MPRSGGAYPIWARQVTAVTLALSVVQMSLAGQRKEAQPLPYHTQETSHNKAPPANDAHQDLHKLHGSVRQAAECPLTSSWNVDDLT
jgi:hypothetical protein